MSSPVIDVNAEKADLDLLTPAEDRADTALHPAIPEVKPPVKIEEPLPEEEEVEEKTEEKIEEEPEPEPEKDEERIIADRPSVKDVKAKYPEFFKDFPQMRHMLFRETEYSNVFPTVGDAKEAAERSDNFGYLEGLITSGKQEDFLEFLDTVKSSSSTAVGHMAANFLPSLHKMSPDLYFQVTEPIAQQVLRAAFEEGKSSGNTNLQYAAQHIAKYLFKDEKYATGEMSVRNLTAAKSDPERDKLNADRREFEGRKYNELHQGVITAVGGSLDRIIRAGLDPDGVLSPYMTEKIVEGIIKELGYKVVEDKQHMRIMNSLWSKAARAGYTPDWKARIVSAYMARAKSLIPAIRSRHIQEAVPTGKKATPPKDTRVEVPAGGNAGGGKGTPRNSNSREVDWSKTSDEDYLAGKTVYKK